MKTTTITEHYDGTIESNINLLQGREKQGWFVRQVVALPGSLLVVYEVER